jgi:hypothetical protein
MKIIARLFAMLSLVGFISTSTIIQGYWALWAYRTVPSSSCIDCDIFSDLLLSSVLPILGWLLLQSFFFWKKSPLRIKTICFVITLIICWVTINTQIFNEREASWSTYTNVWMIGISLSFLPSAILGIITGCFYYFINLKLSKTVRTPGLQ